MFKNSLLICAALLVAGTVHADSSAASGRRYIAPPAPTDNRPAPPFSEGVLAGGVFYVAGHIGLDPATQKVPTNPDGEAHAVLDAVQKTLAEAGLSMDDLVSVTIYCTDLALYDGFNTVYRTYFHGSMPARAFIGVNQLVRGAHFEIQATADGVKAARKR